ncbi:MAG: hypothetical protein ABMA25_03545 [Ilumatobacteraceae bacterium]
MVTNTPSPVDRRQVVLATTSKILGRSAIPREQLTSLVVDALAPRMAGPEVLQYLGGVLGSRESFATTSGGVVHVPALMDSIGWTIIVDGYDAMADLLLLDGRTAPIERWSRGFGKLAVLEGRGALGRVRRITIATTCEFDDADDADATDEANDWESEVEALRGPSGWLMPFADSQAVFTTQGAELHIAPSRRPARPTQRQLAALRVGFDRAHAREVERFKWMSTGGFQTCSPDECLLEAVVADRVAFLAAPVAPMKELFEAAGLRARGLLACRAATAA